MRKPWWWDADTEDDSHWGSEFDGEDMRDLVRERNRLLAGELILRLRLGALQQLSDEATPGPWIRRWESLAVHHMTGDDSLMAMRDIDFAVAACAFVRQLLQERGRN